MKDQNPPALCLPVLDMFLLLLRRSRLKKNFLFSLLILQEMLTLAGSNLNRNFLGQFVGDQLEIKTLDFLSWKLFKISFVTIKLLPKSNSSYFPSRGRRIQNPVKHRSLCSEDPSSKSFCSEYPSKKVSHSFKFSPGKYPVAVMEFTLMSYL